MEHGRTHGGLVHDELEDKMAYELVHDELGCVHSRCGLVHDGLAHDVRQVCGDERARGGLVHDDVLHGVMDI